MTNEPTKQEVTAELGQMLEGMVRRGAPNSYDFQGFSKIDYGFGASLFQGYQKYGNLSTKQIRGAQKMLRKYKRQLGEMGFSVDGVGFTAIPDEPVVARPPMTVTKTGDRLFFDTHGWDPETTAKIKRIGGRRWHPDNKTWSVPQDSISEALVEFPDNQELRAIGESLKGQVFHVFEEETSAEIEQLEAQLRVKYAEMCASTDPTRNFAPHQVHGVARMLAEPSFILGDDTGLGKTRQAIITAIERGGRKLVICPATPKANWRDEILMVDPTATINIISGSAGADPDAEWNIINYDILKRNAESLRAGNEAPTIVYQTLIADEGHRCKNPKSQRGTELLGRKADVKKKVTYYAGLIDFAKHVLILTGTPIRNRPMDLFPLLTAIRHKLSKNFFKYALRYCAAVNNGFGWDFSGKSNLDELGQKIADRFLQRTKEQELPGFPEKTRSYRSVDVDLSEYELLVDQLETDVEFGLPVIAMMTKLKVATAIAAVPSTIDLVDDLLEADQKVLIFSGHTDPINQLKAHYGDMAVVIDGNVPTDKRIPLAKQFCSDPKIRVFIGQHVAAGEAINLQAASQVVFNDLDYVPGTHQQCEDRAWRMGQVNHVTSTYIIPAGTLAEELKAINTGKMETVTSVEQAVANEVLRKRQARKAT